ncbi:MAG: 8-amino-7-oxononanoate synthase [Thermodesulfovibrio sp.]|nr:8-amino-7-oxononanoate synthase [Thermodesulfovibrio sp.]
MSEKIFEIFEKKIEELKEKLLYRSIRDAEALENMKITINGKVYINFASNDYLGLSKHPLVIEAAKNALELFGVGSCASRLLSGGTILHRKVEELLCEFKDVEASLILNSGYTANISLIPALADEGDIILSDELNHASIIDGCRLSKAKKFIYKHGDTEEIEKILKKISCKGKKLIVTDTVFSMDGDIAPLYELYELCKNYEALLYIDDAHGTGVLGDGYGALKHFGLKPDSFVIQMGTFSKAVGAFGAFVGGSKTLINWFVNTARALIFSTALPTSVIAAAYVSLKIIRENKNLTKKLWENTEKVRETIRKLELQTTKSQTPIVPILFESIQKTQKASEILSSFGIYAPVIRPPTVKIPRIRLSISAAHKNEEIERLSEALIHLSQQLHQV